MNQRGILESTVVSKGSFFLPFSDSILDLQKNRT